MPNRSDRYGAKIRPKAAYWVKISMRRSSLTAVSISSMSASTLPERCLPFSVTSEPSPRKCAGWLQICLMRVMVARTRPLRDIPWRSSSCFCTSSTSALYRDACSVVISTRMICSVFSGRSSMIFGSVLRRRKINGAVSWRRRSVMVSSCSRSMALAKWLRKNDAEPSTPGLQKSKMERISDRRFSTGVPVSATRWREGNERTAFDTRVEEFLIACASSSTTRSKPTWPMSLKSRVITPYEVIIKSMPLD